MAGRTGGRAEKSNVSTPTGKAGIHPKPDGKQRPLGVPTIRDRTVETAAVLVLEPNQSMDEAAQLFRRLFRAKPDQPYAFLTEIAGGHRFFVAHNPQVTK